MVQHLLFAFLAIIAPVWDSYATRRLKRNPGSAQKIGYYKTLCAWLWIASFLGVTSVGFRGVFTIAPITADAAWLFGHAWIRFLVETVLVLFAALMLLPYVTVAWKKLKNRPRSYRSADAFKSLEYFLPATRTERRWWVFVSITAGICEETLFRGFLLHHLHFFPWTLNLTLALLISSLIFGLNHLFGGIGEVVFSATAGFLFGLLFLLGGNLLLPVILHAFIDLRMLVILRPTSEQTAPLSNASNS
jgi:membrane protease YdiL (CAAX protease family)